MARFIFASIAHSNKLCYVYNTNDFNSRMLCSCFRYYETYGDGQTAHSPDAPIGMERLADYLFSLAEAMSGSNEKLVDAVNFDLRLPVSKEQIAFAASVKYKEGKDRFYSIKELKVSLSPSKRNDRRYELIQPRHDGSPVSIYALLNRDMGIW